MGHPLDIFGSTDPRNMPGHLFSGAVHFNYETAIEGDPSRQNYSVCPRYWFVDVTCICGICRSRYVWSATEQKTWFEEWKFWVDSRPRHCQQCRRRRRQQKNARKEYDAIVEQARVGSDPELKKRVVCLIEEMSEAGSVESDKIRKTYVMLQQQLKDLGKESGG